MSLRIGLCVGLIVAWVTSGLAQQSTVATVADAKAVLDLSQKPLTTAVGEPQLTVAYQNFQSKGQPDAIAKKIDSDLTSKGFQQLPGAMFNETYTSASYEKGGFTFTVSVMPSTDQDSFVTVMNLGNLDFKKLPKIKGLKELFVQAQSAIYTSDLAVADATAAIQQALQADGWEWFGDTTASFFMRKNAIRLQVMCSESPTEKGKSMVQFSAEQMSTTLPFLKGLQRLSYNEPQMTLEGDSPQTTEAVLAEYRKLLEGQGWKATTDKPLEIDHRQHLIFRNPQQELAELRVHTFDGLGRFELQFMTAEMVKQEDARAEKAAGDALAKQAAEKARMDNPTPLILEKMEGAKLTEESPESLEFNIKSGTAQATLNKWLKACESQGWKVERTIDTKEAGDFTLTKDDATLSVGFMDPGFIPGEITIRTQSGFKLEIKK